MTGPRVFEYAKEVGLETIALMNKLREWNIPVRNHMAELDEPTVELIKQKFAAEQTKGADGSATKKKAVAKKKVEAKKDSEAAEPKATAKKAVAKKVTKTKASADEAPASKKVVKKSSGVIRRKASEMAESREPSQEEIQEQEAVVEETAPVVEPREVATVMAREEVVAEVVAPQQEPEVKVAVEKPAPVVATPVQTAPATDTVAKRPSVKKEVVIEPSEPRGRNIVGRMDLSRAVGPQGTRPSRPGGPGSGFSPRPRGEGGPGGPGGGFNRGAPGGGPSGPRPMGTGGPRSNIRTGFVSTAPVPTFEDERRRFEDRRRKPAAAATGDAAAEGAAKEGEEQPTFLASEFRKREMIFQPKKKTVSMNREAKQTQITKPKASKMVVKIHDKIQVSELAKEMGVKGAQLMTALVKSGVAATLNEYLDFDTATLIASEFGYEIENVKKSAEELVKSNAFGDLNAERVTRPPIVTVMGHVDHGKTSLLDAIRQAKVAAGEAGGITQHIGAYTVDINGQAITFLDTPGHAAFTAMRARGANVTDIAIIVVAADDGVMPQTEEAINHAKAAKVPIIVAVNKMDRPGANPEKIKQKMTEFELVPEEWGGTTIFCPVSALQKTGIKELLEQIILVAEVNDLKANPKRSGTGIVIEAKMDKGRGVVATILVKDGTIRQGEYLVAGQSYGRIRAMVNDKGQQVKEAGPSIPVEILGLNEVPSAGDVADVVKDEKQATEVVAVRKEDKIKQSIVPSSKMSLDALFSKVQAGDVKELPIVLKADVSGSAEAIAGMLNKEFQNTEVKIKIVHSAVGGITENDVLLAGTAKGIVVGFNVRPDSGALSLSKREGIEIKSYSIIYELLDDLKKALEGLLQPDIVEKVLGHAAVRDVFTVPKIGAIAGSFIQDGKVTRNALVRVLRDGRIIYDGKISSLKRFKDDAREVAQGFECGIGVENFNDIKVGDTLEVYEKESIAKTL